MSDPSKRSPEDLLKGLFHSVQGVVQSAQEIALSGADQVRKNVFPRGTGLHGIYGVTVTADLGRPRFTVEPFGNLRPNEAGQMVVQDWTEPRTELTEEAEQFLIACEVPGVAEADVRIGVNGQTLTISAERGGRKYQKEIKLPENASMDQIQHACRDGLLEVRVAKAKPSWPNEGLNI